MLMAYIKFVKCCQIYLYLDLLLETVYYQGSATLEVPEGVTMHNKAGSRILQFECDSRKVAEILCDGLDVSGIPWDEMA